MPLSKEINIQKNLVECNDWIDFKDLTFLKELNSNYTETLF